MTSCAWHQSARVRTREIRDRTTRRPISTCGGSSMAKPTSIGTKARSTPLRLADAAPEDRADPRRAPDSNPQTPESFPPITQEMGRSLYLYEVDLPIFCAHPSEKPMNHIAPTVLVA